jgi:predicted NBD/HSP70 family sugar kinase
VVIGLGLDIAAPVQTGSGRIEASGIMPGWVGVNPAEEMRARTGLDVHVINDADAGALGATRADAGSCRRCTTTARAAAPN